MSSLFVFVLQIATLRIGQPVTRSPFARLRTSLLSMDSLQTIFWYLVSAWWFSEAYIWSSTDLGWITRGDFSTPDRLNERPIYLRAYLLLLAVIQGSLHLFTGRSYLHIPVSHAPTPQANDQRTHPIDLMPAQVKRKAFLVLTRCAITSALLILMAPFIYTAFLRHTFWRIHLLLAKPFFNLSRSNLRPPGWPPLGPSYLVRCFIAGFLLSTTWEFSAIFFLAYLKQEPLKKGLPLSAGSKDPNGTLLTGLKAKRDVVKTFAFWELAIIAQKHPDRRKAIFEDIDRPTGPVWSQMLEIALNVLKDVDRRIQGPPTPATPSPNPSITSLPKIAPEVKSQPIFAGMPPPSTRKEKVDAFMSSSALRKVGTSKEPWHPPLDKATKLLEYSKPPGPNDASRSLLQQWSTAFQKSPVGWFFSTNNAAVTNATVLGSPANAALVVDAIESTTKMLVASLSEDIYGKAVAGVPEAVKTFTKTVTLIEKLVKNQQKDTGEIEEVEIVVERLKLGLRELLSAFQLYLADVGLGISELNEAKRASEAQSLLPNEHETNEESEENRRQNGSNQKPVRRQLFSANAHHGEKAADNNQNDQRRPPHEQTRRIERQPSTSARRMDWNGISGRPDQRREMEMVK